MRKCPTSGVGYCWQNTLRKKTVVKLERIDDIEVRDIRRPKVRAGSQWLALWQVEAKLRPTVEKLHYQKGSVRGRRRIFILVVLYLKKSLLATTTMQ